MTRRSVLFFGTQFAFNRYRDRGEPNRRLLAPERGDDVKGPIACASLIAFSALLPALGAAGDEPAGMIVPAPSSPNTFGWSTRAQDNPPIPQISKVSVPSVESPGRSAAIEGHGVDVPDEIAVTPAADSAGDDTIQAEVDEGAFLLPTWDPGFWPMPPGGLTRYLIPARGFINPDVTLAPVPVTVNSG